MLADWGANTPVKTKRVFYASWHIVDYSQKTVQVLFTGAYIPLHVGKGNQQHSQEILTTKDKRAQTEMQTFMKVLEERQKKRNSTVVISTRSKVISFYWFVVRGFRLPMKKLVPESTHHVSHANPDLCEDSTHAPVLMFEIALVHF